LRNRLRGPPVPEAPRRPALTPRGASFIFLRARFSEYCATTSPPAEGCILRGAKPGELPVEQPTKFDLAINLTTAKELKLTIPEAFLLRADELIE
jgi:hypothetical protein